jgi:hypothetical protein
MKVLHIENTPLFLVNVRNIDDNTLEVRCGQSVLIQQSSQSLGRTNAKVDPITLLIIKRRRAGDSVLTCFSLDVPPAQQPSCASQTTWQYLGP